LPWKRDNRFPFPCCRPAKYFILLSSI
jgi:hypothetical protein